MVKRKEERKEGRRDARRREGNDGVKEPKRNKIVEKDDVDGYPRVGLRGGEDEEEIRGEWMQR